MEYRQADESDIAAMSALRAMEWGDEEYWRKRIVGYMRCELNPQQALKARIMYIACQDRLITGFIAGHLTRRYGCHGELEWINVTTACRKAGIASKLFSILAAWFVTQQAFKICVDVDPENAIARNFYMKHGAEELNKHWLFWNDISRC